MPPKKGEAVHLKELSETHKEQFVETQMELYGKQEIIQYYSVDPLWGAEAVPGITFYTFCPGRNKRDPKRPGRHQSGTGISFYHPSVQLPFPD